jgi:hypothetical protein
VDDQRRLFIMKARYNEETDVVFTPTASEEGKSWEICRKHYFGGEKF